MDSSMTTEGFQKRFLIGDAVEVRMTDEGMRGSWFSGVVVEVHKGQRMVEYDDLVEEEDPNRKLRELISVGNASDGMGLVSASSPKMNSQSNRHLLRPRPPVHAGGALTWTAGCCVDCLDADGWWEGVLREDILSISSQDVYSLTRKSAVEIHFPDEDIVSWIKVDLIRIGQDWNELSGLWSLRGDAPYSLSMSRKVDANEAGLEVISAKQVQMQKLAPVPAVFPVFPVPMVSASPVFVAQSKKRLTDLENRTGVENEVDPGNHAVLSIKSKGRPKISARKKVSAKNSKELGLFSFVNVKSLLEDDGEEVRSFILDLWQNHPRSGRQSPVQSDAKDVSVSGTLGADMSTSETLPSLKENLLLDKVKVTDSRSLDGGETESLIALSPIRETLDRDEGAVKMLLEHCGWKIQCDHLHAWSCQSPAIQGPMRHVSSLIEALQIEAYGSLTDISERESRSERTDRREDTSITGDHTVARSEDVRQAVDNVDYAPSVRHILKRYGWEVYNSLKPTSSGENAWMYRTPLQECIKEGRKRAWFSSWQSAADEHIKQARHGDQEVCLEKKPTRGVYQRQTSSPCMQDSTNQSALAPLSTDGSQSASGPFSVDQKYVGPSLAMMPIDDRNLGPILDSGSPSILRQNSVSLMEYQREVEIASEKTRLLTGKDPLQNRSIVKSDLAYASTEIEDCTKFHQES